MSLHFDPPHNSEIPIRIGFQIVFNIALRLWISCKRAALYFDFRFLCDLSKHLIQGSIFPLRIPMPSWWNHSLVFVHSRTNSLSLSQLHHPVLKCHYFNSIWLRVYIFYIRLIHLCISMLASELISMLPHRHNKTAANSESKHWKYLMCGNSIEFLYYWYVILWNRYTRVPILSCSFHSLTSPHHTFDVCVSVEFLGNLSS